MNFDFRKPTIIFIDYTILESRSDILLDTSGAEVSSVLHMPVFHIPGEPCGHFSALTAVKKLCFDFRYMISDM